MTGRAVGRFRPALAWWAGMVGWFAAAAALLLLLNGFYRRELNHFTGAARWMWSTGDLREPVPTAGLFFRRLDLTRRPQRAVAKICGDRQYVLWLNGQPASAGRNRPGFVLDVVDVTDLLVSGSNVIAIEARSPTSVGGVLFALDLFVTAEARRAGDPFGRNCVVSGPGWRVVTGWGEGPLEVPVDGWKAPYLWGEPPDHPWTYPSPEVRSRTIVQAIVSDPRKLEDCREVEHGADRWQCRVGADWQGFLVLDLGGGEVPSAVEVEAGYGRTETVAVVALAGQNEWMFPGRLRGPFVTFEGITRPPAAEVLDALP